MKRLISLFLLVFYTAFLFSGCAVHIHMDQPSENTQSGNASIFDFIFNNSLFKTPMYESRARVYIASAASADASNIPSGELSASVPIEEFLKALLNRSSVQEKIAEKYPNSQYTLTLEAVNDSGVYDIVTTGESAENLEAICNLAVSLFCENVSNVIYPSCKIVDNASPATLVYR